MVEILPTEVVIPAGDSVFSCSEKSACLPLRCLVRNGHRGVRNGDAHHGDTNAAVTPTHLIVYLENQRDSPSRSCGGSPRVGINVPR